MRITGRTILITGGTSGIGLEFARQLLALDNTVIVTGRDDIALEKAKSLGPKLHAIKSDVTNLASISDLFANISEAFPDLSILVNNAGIMREHDILRADFAINELTREIETNLEGPLRMTHAFLPLLLKQRDAAIVNVSSGIAFLPLPPSPVYSAAKAGLHAWSISLRIQLESSTVKVFELAPPLTKTPLGTDTFDPKVIRGIPFMAPERVIQQAISGMRRDRYEIRPGMSGMMKMVARLSPNWMISKSLGSTVRAMREAASGKG